MCYVAIVCVRATTSLKKHSFEQVKALLWACKRVAFSG